ncbi:CHAT domain-containing protein [Talaromyces proteolyticus]|uniref:CHAT domain-containing protein n=1 Tax=Talaromyces proteolyticus TaxID=1131652 RepID=A0AAD4PSY0_9EURO|nr:CHAT domain-containing protein [Talaromyces proteolyticus]KAH8689874.1 CHAT domain-containing protein [Talaromyces proteolyticus]
MKAENDELGEPAILQWLWDAITEPVLAALGYTHTPHDKWPHIWWVPTGLLIKFPLHAAGYHDCGTGQTVIDRVMSSYSPSIKAMIQNRRRPQKPSSVGHALLVAMEFTPGESNLPCASREVDIVRSICPSMSLVPVAPAPYKSDIESLLQVCQIFHFAGHAHMDKSDPSMSYLVLEDGDSNPLTVGNLFEINIRESSPFLAYLSACGTGRIDDERFMDESIHLNSAFQLAGFRHVIGSLWDVIDDTCLHMAKIIYGRIRDGGMTDESVCRGLHDATRTLRDRWQQSSIRTRSQRGLTRDINPVGEDIPSLDWVPYVHFGV